MVSGNSQSCEEVIRISISMENQHPSSFRQGQGLTSILFYHLEQNGKVTHIEGVSSKDKRSCNRCQFYCSKKRTSTIMERSEIWVYE